MKKKYRFEFTSLRHPLKLMVEALFVLEVAVNWFQSYWRVELEIWFFYFSVHNKRFYWVFANEWNTLGNELHLLKVYKEIKISFNKQILFIMLWWQRRTPISFELCIFFILFWVLSTVINRRQMMFYLFYTCFISFKFVRDL